MADKKSVKGTVSRLAGDERRRALEVALGKIEKDFGKGSVMRLGDQADRMQVEVIPTGCRACACAGHRGRNAAFRRAGTTPATGGKDRA